MTVTSVGPTLIVWKKKANEVLELTGALIYRRSVFKGK